MATSAAYEARWHSLVRLAGHINPKWPAQFDQASSVARWLASRHGHYRPNTFRQYKAAFSYALAETPLVSDQDRINISALAARHSLPPDTVFGVCRKLPDRTSSAKRKRFDQADFERLLHVLCTSKTPLDAYLAVFLQANVTVGLRPSEWIGAELTEDNADTVILKVQNGKATNGRANGSERTLRFGHDQRDDAIRSIAPCIALVRLVLEGRTGDATSQKWKAFCRALQDRFRVLNRRIWPRRARHYTLYSTRHTLLAAAKAQLTAAEVAAIAGHASAETATRHYARPAHSGGVNPRCLIPDFDGAIFSSEWKDALWARFYTGAPQRQRQSVERYNIVKRA